MDNETISSLESQIITDTYQGTVQAYNWVAAITLFTYASLLHLEDEVQYIWRAKFTLPTYLYWFSKYPFFFVLSLQIVEIFTPEGSSRLCDDLGLLAGLITIFSLIGTLGLISIRAYALSQGYRPILMIILSIAFLIALVSALYSFATIPFCTAAESASLIRIHGASIILLDTVAFLVVVRQIWGIWRLRQDLGLQNNIDLATLLIRQGVLRFMFALLITIIVIIVATFPTFIASNLGIFQEAISSLVLCEFTLDLRRRNAEKSEPNQSALNLPTISFHQNPIQSIQTVLGRLHESIVAEMGERIDSITIDDPCLEESELEADANSFQDNPHGTDSASGQVQLGLTA